VELQKNNDRRINSKLILSGDITVRLQFRDIDLLIRSLNGYKLQLSVIYFVTLVEHTRIWDSIGIFG